VLKLSRSAAERNRAQRSTAPEVFWKPERHPGTSGQVEGGAPRLLHFRLRFSGNLKLNLCDIFLLGI